MARAIDADRLADGLKLHRQPTDQKHEADRQWAVGYNAGLDRALHSIAYAPTLTQPNEPLTLEQLREMDGEPVWVKCLEPNKYDNPPVRWRILEKSIIGTFGVWGGESGLIERNYGTDWLAYRRPPEGEA